MYCTEAEIRCLIISPSLSPCFFPPPQQEDDKVLKLVQKKFCASGPYTGKMSAKSRNGVFVDFHAMAAILKDETVALQSREVLCFDSGV